MIGYGIKYPSTCDPNDILKTWEEANEDYFYCDVQARGYYPRYKLKEYERNGDVFSLNDKEKDIIVKHMWPVTLLSFPKYKESFLITIFDKRSALKSFFEYNKKQFSNTKFYRYAYIFFTGLLFRIF